MKRKISLLMILLLAALTGCQQPVPPAEPPQTAAEVPAPPAEELPELKITVGTPTTVNGYRLPTGSVRIHGLTYLRMDELCTALKGRFSDNVLQWDGGTVTFFDGSRRVYVDGDDRTRLLPAQTAEKNGILYVPMELCGYMGMDLFEDTERSHLYITPSADPASIPEGYKVPALMYHAVSDDMWGYEELFVRPEEMEAQLQYLNENGYTTIHFSDLARIDEIEKPVLLTFDDGYLDNYEELYPLLQKYNCKATVFVITESLGTHPLYMTWAQAREMADSGLVSIQSHTATHPNLDELTAEEQTGEFARSRLDIARNTGRTPYVLSYPVGRTGRQTAELASQYYAFAVKMNGYDYVTGEDPMAIERHYVYRWLSMHRFASMVD